MEIAPRVAEMHSFKVDPKSHMSKILGKTHTSHGFNSTYGKIETDLRKTLRGYLTWCCNLSIGISTIILSIWVMHIQLWEPDMPKVGLRRGQNKAGSTFLKILQKR